MTSLPVAAPIVQERPDNPPLVLTGLIGRSQMLALFEQLDRDSDIQARFLDNPAEVLAAEIGLDPATQKVSADNALLVALLRSPDLRAWVRDIWPGLEPSELTVSSDGDSFGDTTAHASVSSSTNISSSMSTDTSASVSTSSTFTTGGVSGKPSSGIDPATLRLTISQIVACMRRANSS